MSDATTPIPFGEYRPDVADYQSGFTRTLLNVIPRGDGYGPFNAFSPYSAALPGPCRGFFKAIKIDGSVTIFAATATKLYQLNNTLFTWTDVSLAGGLYGALSATDNWQFVQFGNFVIAVQQNVVPQVFDLTASTAFANLAGSPPQSRYISVVGRFVVLSGLQANPYRIQWSGLNDATNWTSGVNSSDFQDFPDGGIVRGVAGGEYGVIFQDTSIRNMTYAPGNPVVFIIERVADDRGLYAPYSVVRSGERIFFLAAHGFQQIITGTDYPTPIGKEKVDRTFLADLDRGNLQLLIGASDPRTTRVYWAYKSSSGSAGLFDRILCYDWAIDRFTLNAVTGEYLGSMAQPGITLEALDPLAAGAIAITGAANNGSGLIRLSVAGLALPAMPTPSDHAAVPTQLVTGAKIAVSGVGGTTEANAASWTITVVDSTHIDLQGSSFAHAYTGGGTIAGCLDAMLASLDGFATSVSPEIAAFDANHTLGFFRGAALQATLETSEQGAAGRRIFVRGFRPITDAATVFGAVSARETQQAAPTLSAETAINAIGLCPARVSTRYARGHVRIPAGTSWTFAAGVEPDVVPLGEK